MLKHALVRSMANCLMLVVVLVQSSLTGNGARISVICTVTPASSQAEETHNTLKFATRAKKIEITAQRNEIVDQASLIRRYQEEIQTLRSQLDTVARERGGQIPMPAQIHDPLHPEVGGSMGVDCCLLGTRESQMGTAVTWGGPDYLFCIEGSR